MSRYSSAASAGGRALADRRRQEAARRLEDAPGLFLRSLASFTTSLSHDVKFDDVRVRQAVVCAYVAAARMGRTLTRRDDGRWDGEGQEAPGEVELIDAGMDPTTRWETRDRQAYVAARRALRLVDWDALSASVLLDGWRAAFPLLHDAGRTRPRLR